MAVRAGQAGARVDHEQHGVAIVQRRLGLRAHAAGQRGRVALLQARGVDNGEVEVAEARLALAPVARDAGLVVDQRELAADEPVEQRRLADVGPADDGDFGAQTCCGRRRLRGDEAEQRLGGLPVGLRRLGVADHLV